MKFFSKYIPLILLFAVSCMGVDDTRLTDYVNPLIGSGGHGHVFVGANVPFGMVQLGPTSINEGWDWCSGYHRDEATVIGFSHTHLSGTGIGDMFDVTVMPVVGEVTYARGTVEEPGSGLWSMADRSQEVAEVGYYSVPLERYGIKAEMTATARVGLHRYTFPESKEAALVFDLENGGCWDDSYKIYMQPEGNNRIVGYRFSTGWAWRQRVYFVAEFQKPFDSFQLKGNGQYGRASFSTTDGEQVLLKVALSPVSIDGARLAMESELPGWDFEAVRSDALEAWEKELERVKISAAEDSAKQIFYTALYHSMMAPMLFSDVNGDYRGADDSVYNSAVPRYTGLSLWDTYRAKQPFMTIVQPERAGEFVATMIDICDKQGDLPVWHLWGNETDCMVGDPGIPVVADAIVKGLGGFDREEAFEAIKQTAALRERGKEFRQDYGYIPCDLRSEAVAFDMEYAIADGAAANAAKALGRTDDYKYFTDKSHSYRTYFDKESGFIRGVDSKGNFRSPFNPYFAAHRKNDYCEGNAWQYSWLVPHDIDGYAALFGGRKACVERLDSLFLAPWIEEGNASPDISGLIGQFAHGNEPSHHILYLYTMLGEPHKCAERVREVMRTQYRNGFDGLSGNEDMGQMSAWYIMSALGFYQVEPAGGRYWFGSPIVDRAELTVKGGKFTIETTGNSDRNIYIKSIELNGEKYSLPYILHSDIAKGGKLVIEMGDKPSLWYDADILCK
ncbi:MAG: GH92 family glycosyl hydrolase [Bacteroidaceae bacterium]|nr:GH92 family glycosyl hydrolase [Bacteroidaceae bacterium]